MAEVTPFRGIRYQESIALDEVVAPPYDVIPAAQAAELRERSPHNAVHLDLPVAPGEAAQDAAYARAAAAFERWQAGGAAETQAVDLRSGMRALVRKDDALREVGQAEPRDEAATCAFAAVGPPVGLIDEVQAGRLLTDQHAAGLPPLESGGGVLVREETPSLYLVD